MRVLAPIDGSEAGLAVLDRGFAMLAGSKASVTLLNCRQGDIDRMDPELVAELEVDEHDEMFPSAQSSQRALARATAVAQRHGLAATPKSVVGNYRKVILEEAANHDLLIMKGLGKSSVKDTMRGVAAESIVRNAPCAVLLVRAE